MSFNINIEHSMIKIFFPVMCVVDSELLFVCLFVCLTGHSLWRHTTSIGS